MSNLNCPRCKIVHLSRADWCAIPTFEDFEALVGEEKVRYQQHDGMNLYKYGRDAMWEQWWEPAMIAARGIVFDDHGNQLNHVFDKFHNYEQLDDAGVVPDGTPTIFEKFDGSMISVFFHGGRWIVTSSGSFKSEQVEMATEILDTSLLSPTYDYVFELIHPENKIVVDYGLDRRLVCLKITDKFGNDEPASLYPDSIVPINADPEVEVDNAEGYVLQWESGARAKVKFATYKNLHKVLFNLSPKKVRESVIDETFDDLVAKVGPYDIAWVQQTASEFNFKVNEFLKHAEGVVRTANKKDWTRKGLAQHVFSDPSERLQGAMFALLDGDRERAIKVCQMQVMRDFDEC